MSQNHSRRETLLRDRLDQRTRTLGAVFVAMVAVSIWASVVATAVRSAARSLGGLQSLFVLSAVTWLLGFGLGTVAYTRYRGFDLGLTWPGHGAWPTAGLAIATPVALTLVVAVVGNTLFDVSLSLLADRRISPNAGVDFVVTQLLPPVVFLGIGYGIFLAGVVGETLRAAFDADEVAWVGGLVVGYFWLLPLDAVGRLPLTLGSAFELAVTLVFGVGFGLAVGTLYGVFQTGASLADLSVADWLLFAVAIVGVFGIVSGLSDVGKVVIESLWIVALATATAGYLRTRSAWVAVVTLVGFTVTLQLVIYVESVTGLVAF